MRVGNSTLIPNILKRVFLSPPSRAACDLHLCRTKTSPSGHQIVRRWSLLLCTAMLGLTRDDTNFTEEASCQRVEVLTVSTAIYLVRLARRPPVQVCGRAARRLADSHSHTLFSSREELSVFPEFFCFPTTSGFEPGWV